MTLLPSLRSATSLFVAAVFGLGCASTQVETKQTFLEGQLPRPDRILVYDFAVSPGEVRLDRGISAKLADAAKGTPRSAQEREVGRKVADALSEHLVQYIRKLGLPAQRGFGSPPTWGTSLEIEGSFLSIDEGNRTERVVIGLGAGRSDVETDVRLYQGADLLEEFHTVAKSGRKPGAAETMGVGAAAGNLAVSAAATAAVSAGSEAFGANVEADASRTAKEIAKKLADFFVRQNWITEEAAKEAFGVL